MDIYPSVIDSHRPPAQHAAAPPTGSGRTEIAAAATESRQGDELMREIGVLPRREAEALGRRMQELAAVQASLDHDFISLVDEFDTGKCVGWFDGIKSTAHYIAWACSMSAGPAREHVRVARALRTMPQTKAAFRQGRLSYSKVRELTRLAGQVDEDGLVPLALQMTASQLARTVSGFRSAAGTRMRAERKRGFRSVQQPDGMVRVTVVLAPEEAAVVTAAIETAARRATAPVDPAPEARVGDSAATAPDQAASPRGPSEHSAQPGLPTDAVWTPPMRDTVQALVDVAAGYLETTNVAAADDHTLVVVQVNAAHLTSVDPTVGRVEPAAQTSAETVPAGTPADDDSGTTAQSARAALAAGTCYVEGQGPIEAATALRLACTASLIGALVDAHGEVLALGRTVRLATRAQRRALRVRDKGICQFDGCHQTHHLEAHHIVPWACGGPTDLDNLILLCRRHHVLVHEGGITITRDPKSSRRYTFRLPDGDPITGTWLEFKPKGVEHRAQLHYRSIATDPTTTGEQARIFPLHAGAGFSLHECVRVLFGHITPDPTDHPDPIDHPDPTDHNAGPTDHHLNTTDHGSNPTDDHSDTTDNPADTTDNPAAA